MLFYLLSVSEIIALIEGIQVPTVPVNCYGKNLCIPAIAYGPDPSGRFGLKPKENKRKN